MKHCRIAITLCILFLLPISGAESGGSNVTGIYSDMHSNKATGDVLGIEIIVVYSAQGYVVIFQSSEGMPSVPIVVPAIISGNNIEFTLPDSHGYSGVFKGIIGPSQLKGRFERGQVNYKGEKIINLRKGKSYWQ